MCCDAETERQDNLDVARFLIKTKFSINLNEVTNVEINEKVYRIKLFEDFHGPKQIVVRKKKRVVSES